MQKKHMQYIYDKNGNKEHAGNTEINNMRKMKKRVNNDRNAEHKENEEK